MPGLLFGDDYSRLIHSIHRVMSRFKFNKTLNFVEIGIHEGETSRDLIKEIKRYRAIRVFYFGIDPGVENPNIDGMIFLNKFSHMAIEFLPNELHWCLVDGDHCEQCVERDLRLYSEGLVPGGEILFHDASPLTQGRDPQDYAFMSPYHDSNIAKKGIAVRKVLDKQWPSLKLIQKAPEIPFGGVECYERI